MREVTAQEIQRVLEVTDRLGVHREQVAIPLAARRPGRVRRLSGGKLEIVVDADADFDAWLAGLEAELRRLAV